MLAKSLAVLSTLTLIATAAGCGDPPICNGDVFVVIQAPSTQVTADLDSATLGVQTPVRVRTSLAEGDVVTLDVAGPDGHPVVVGEQAVDGNGVATFASVTLPTPRATIHAVGKGLCGQGADAVIVDVSAGAHCGLTISPAPTTVPYYGAIGVLNGASDPDPATPGVQGSIEIATGAGWSVEVFLTDATGEHSLGSTSASPSGAAVMPTTFFDGQLALRAVCAGPAGEVAPSLTTTIVVDATSPSCDLTSPAPGSTITPSYDANGDLSDGIQLTIGAHIGGADTVGEPASFTITPDSGGAMTLAGSLVDAAGESAVAATLAPPTTPAMTTIAINGQDHAGNTCASSATYAIVYAGCDLQVTAPTGPVTVDADGNRANGAQLDLGLAVGAACVGRTVTTDCGSNHPSGVVPVGGQLALRVDVCATSPCEAQTTCTARVTTIDGVETATSTTLTFDNQPPAVSVAVITPTLACGAVITPASDADPVADGVQLVARVTAPTAATRSLQLTSGSATTTYDATGDVTLTIAPGPNALVGIAADALGNRAQTAACTVSLADLSVSFAPPAADGAVAIKDGVVSAGGLTFNLCGTVSATGASVALAIDGAAAVPATVAGNGWCRSIKLAASPPAHTIVATATAGSSFGTATLVLNVDLAPPGAVTGFAAAAVNRQRLHLGWTAPSDGGQRAASYLLKYATTALTDANFDTTGSVVPTGLPAAPGTAESLDLFPERTGTALWVGIASVDAAGNRATAAIIGPVTPTFTQSGAITAPDQSLGNLNLGAAIAHGKFNDDDYDDVAVAAPTQFVGGKAQVGAVYVYFGGPTGIGATPGLVLNGTTTSGRFGAALTAVRWSSATRDDLVIGAPAVNAGAGGLFVFRGGAGLGTGARLASSADALINANPVTPGWFAGGALGQALATADVDGDGVDDLVASAVNGGGTRGGVIVIYGGTAPGNVLLSDLDPSGLGGAVVSLLEDPSASMGHQFGYYLHAVGPTQGASDLTDDLVVGYYDDATTANDSVYVLRGDGTRPAASAVTRRSFVAGRDVRIDYVTPYKLTEWGAQVTTIEDLNGNGTRELVISAYRTLGGAGQVVIVEGGALGTAGVALSSDPAVALTTIGAGGSHWFGAAIAAHDGRSRDDVDGDGHEDLLIGGVVGTSARLYTWFGGTIPLGVSTTASSGYAATGPSTFLLSHQNPEGPAAQARWVGDVDGDGLDDLCWSSPYDNNQDGSFEVLR
jgi:hypothetical protein